MDAILVIDGYNRLLCIDVYLPDYATIRPIPKWADDYYKVFQHTSQRTVPLLPSPSDINQLYLIIPPRETIPENYSGASYTLGAGDQGCHNEGVTDPLSPPSYYWAIAKTNGVDDPKTRRLS